MKMPSFQGLSMLRVKVVGVIMWEGQTGRAILSVNESSLLFLWVLLLNAYVIKFEKVLVTS